MEGSSTTEQVLAVLRDPEVIEATAVPNRKQCLERMHKYLRRRVERLAVFRKYAHRGGSAVGLRVVTNPPASVNVYIDHDHPDGGFVCCGVHGRSVAEALLGGYFVSELTDDPIPDTFK